MSPAVTACPDDLRTSPITGIVGWWRRVFCTKVEWARTVSVSPTYVTSPTHHSPNTPPFPTSHSLSSHAPQLSHTTGTNDHTCPSVTRGYMWGDLSLSCSQEGIYTTVTDPGTYCYHSLHDQILQHRAQINCTSNHPTNQYGSSLQKFDYLMWYPEEVGKSTAAMRRVHTI